MRKCKRRVRCTLCTPHRWMGNHKDRFDAKTVRRKKVAQQEVRDYAG